jgi:hypothetical protein
MNLKYETELNNSIIKLANSLMSLEPEMHNIGNIINQKLSKHQGDFLYGELIMRINNISQKLIDCYNVLSYTSTEIKECVQSLRDSSEKNLVSSFIEDYPMHIIKYSEIVNDHVQFIRSIKEILIAWNGDYKTPDSIIQIDLNIFEYLNDLEGSVAVYDKITYYINSSLESND